MRTLRIVKALDIDVLNLFWINSCLETTIIRFGHCFDIFQAIVFACFGWRNYTDLINR